MIDPVLIHYPFEMNFKVIQIDELAIVFDGRDNRSALEIMDDLCDRLIDILNIYEAKEIESPIMENALDMILENKED